MSQHQNQSPDLNAIMAGMMNEPEMLATLPDPGANYLEWIRSDMARKGIKKPLVMASSLGKVQYTTSGIKELDDILKPTDQKEPGGFPLGRVTEIYGLEGVGKTSLTLQSIAGMQKAGKKVLFIDVENALNITRAAQFGVDLDTLAVSTEVTIEAVSDTILDYVEDFQLIVIDSLAAMIPQAEYDGEAGETHMGLKARQMGQMMRKIIKPLSDSKCALIFINQQRENLGPFTAKYFTPGGKAVPFATSLRIELKSPKKDKIESSVKGVKDRTGQWITATVVKTKVGKPYAEARFKLLY